MGVTYYGTWVNSQGQQGGLTDWLVMCGNSAGVVLRGQERKNIAGHVAVKSSGDVHLFINEGVLQKVSDFGVGHRLEPGALRSRDVDQHGVPELEAWFRVKDC